MPFARSSSSRPRGPRGREEEPPELADEPPADPVSVARQICLHQLEHAPRTRTELAAVLARRGVPDDAAEEVLGRFEEVGLIDDAAFAQAWVSTRHAGRGLARGVLTQELRRRGVDDEVVATAVGTLDPDVELATAQALVARKLRSTASLPTDVRVRRLAGMLARKGYPSAVAFRVVREALAEEGRVAQAELDALHALEE